MIKKVILSMEYLSDILVLLYLAHLHLSIS